MSDVFELRERIAILGRVVGHLSDLSYLLTHHFIDDDGKDKILIDSVLYKYDSVLDSVKSKLKDIQDNCDHEWVFQNYGASDRVMKCSKCQLVRPEGRI